MRPQVRRLAIQAEQAASRKLAGDELLDALLLSAHVRWFEAHSQIAAGADLLRGGRSEVDEALTELSVLETAAGAAAIALEERARTGAELRRALDEARSGLTALQLEEGRQQSERAAVARDRSRLAQERAAAEADLAVQRRRLATPVPERDLTLGQAVVESERELAAALAELAHLQSVDRARDADEAALRRASAARAADAEQAQRRLADAERRAADEVARAEAASDRLQAAELSHAEAATALVNAAAAEKAATSDREAASASWERVTALVTTTSERASVAAASLAGARARAEAAEAAIEDDRSSGFAARMRGRGARRLDEGIVVDPGLRAAIDAALAGAGRAYLTTRDSLESRQDERGLAVVVDGLAAPEIASATGRDGGPQAELSRRLASVGGGYLRDAVRRDTTGAAQRLLGRAVWAPTFEAALGLQPYLPAGWVAVPRNGSAVVGEVTVRLGVADGTLERRAHHEFALEERRAAEAAAAEAAGIASSVATELAEARGALDAARGAEAASVGERRRAEEAERLAARGLESLVREAAWQAAQVQRIRGRGRPRPSRRSGTVGAPCAIG